MPRQLRGRKPAASKAKPKAKPQSRKTKSGTVQVMFLLPEQMRLAIRAHAALNDMTMSAIAEQAFDSYLDPKEPTPTQEAQKLLNAIGRALINS